MRSNVFKSIFIFHSELNDLRKNVCLRKSDVSYETISVCNIIENFAEHGIHCLPCSYTNDVINVAVKTVTSYVLSIVSEIKFCQGA